MHASRIKSRAVECIQDRGPPSQVLGPMHASSPHSGTELSRRARTGLPTTAVHPCYLFKAPPDPPPRQGKSGLLREIFKWSTDMQRFSALKSPQMRTLPLGLFTTTIGAAQSE